MHLPLYYSENTTVPSIYDYDLNLSSMYKTAINKNKIGIVKALLANSEFLSLIEKQDSQFVAVLTDEQKKGIENGIFKFVKDKNGNIFADLRKRSNGQIVAKVNLKEVNLSASNISKVNDIILQQQINDIIKELEFIKEGINDILAGQHNDRISKAKSAYSQYLLLSQVDDMTMRSLIIQNIINISTESFFSIAETLSYNICKFKELEERKEKRLNKVVEGVIGLNDQKTQDIADDIFKQTEALFYASMVRVLAYSELDKKSAQVMPLKDLSLFLNRNINNVEVEKLNGWISENNNFWTREFLPRRNKINLKIEKIERNLLLS